MPTIAELLKQGSNTLQGTDNPRLEAELLLCAVLNCDRVKLIAWPQNRVNEEQTAAYLAFIQRRTQHEPLAYIIGSKEFWSLPFHVTSNVLVPRPETELLVETVLAQLPNEPLTIIELGTGSGAIACALAHERPIWQIIATDISAKALIVAKENAQALQLANIKWLQSDWFASIPLQKVAAIISNPPYLSHDDQHLKNELLHEPLNALVSGESGLEAYEAIILKAMDYLEEGGLLAFEHGFAQHPLISEILIKNGFTQIQNVTDLAGLPRVTYGRKK